MAVIVIFDCLRRSAEPLPHALPRATPLLSHPSLCAWLQQPAAPPLAAVTCAIATLQNLPGSCAVPLERDALLPQPALPRVSPAQRYVLLHLWRRRRLLNRAHRSEPLALPRQSHQWVWMQARLSEQHCDRLCLRAAEIKWILSAEIKFDAKNYLYRE